MKDHYMLGQQDEDAEEGNNECRGKLRFLDSMPIISFASCPSGEV